MPLYRRLYVPAGLPGGRKVLGREGGKRKTSAKILHRDTKLAGGLRHRHHNGHISFGWSDPLNKDRIIDRGCLDQETIQYLWAAPKETVRDKAIGEEKTSQS